MIVHNTDIVLDLSTDGERAEVWAKQDDGGTRSIRATFQSGGTSVLLSSVDHAELRVLRPDGGMITSEATIDGNAVIATLTENALSVGGRGYGDIRLLDGESNCISAARFVLHIEPAAVSNNEVAQSSDFVALLNEYMGGMKLRKLSKSEYEALAAKDPDTLYTVTDGDSVTQYLGEIKLKSGSGSAGALTSIYNGTTSTTAGTLTEGD